MSNQTISLESQIQSIIHKDNQCTAHFDYSRNRENVALTVKTYNPKNKETFVLKEITAKDDDECLSHVLKYLESVTSEESPFTVVWRRHNEGDSFKSYFYAKNIRHLLDKFYKDKNEADYLIESITRSPMA